MYLHDHKRKVLTTADWFGKNVFLIGNYDLTAIYLNRMKSAIASEAQALSDYKILTSTSFLEGFKDFDQIIFIADEPVDSICRNKANGCAKKVKLISCDDARGLCDAQYQLSRTDWMVARECEKLLPVDHPLRVERDQLRALVDDELKPPEIPKPPENPRHEE